MATTSDSPIRVIAYYPVEGPVVRRVSLGVSIAPHTIISNRPALDSLFGTSPIGCPHCPKPYFMVEDVPDAAFTMLSTCPHAGEVKKRDGVTNVAVRNLLLPNTRALVGPIVICKHERSTKEVPDGLMTLLDVTEADLLLVNEFVVRYTELIQ
ncbi:hypothetical protein C8F01DRAFT_1266150 [Mycena amicta]|nr:hypothetical protein C8F01DRAFT_1266150 [Mycena amicta]